MQVRKGLVPLIQEIKAKGTPPDSSILQGNFDMKAQSALCHAIAVDIGFSLEQGRLDVSVHPFTGGRPFFLVLFIHLPILLFPSGCWLYLVMRKQDLMNKNFTCA